METAPYLLCPWGPGLPEKSWVISRHGIFMRIKGVPDAVGLAESTAMPLGMELPAPGASVEGVVYWHDAHNHQVRVRLDEWQTEDE